MLVAWSRFSAAFGEYPFDGTYVYRGPSQYGPANLLYGKPTGYRSTMVGFPYDDVAGWRGIYPADVLAGQFATMASGWQTGLSAFGVALEKIGEPDRRHAARRDFAVAQAIGLHFDSVANQIEFIAARDSLLSGSLSQSERDARIETLRTILADEIRNAKTLLALTRQDPRLGFEASNHYYYLPLDLVEKVINCEYLLEVWLAGQ
ncbi:MAG: hypothetical protein ACYTAS_08445 [Planctomycetota bacterium]